MTDSRELFWRSLGHGRQVLQLEELRVSLSDEDLDRVRGGLLRQRRRLAVQVHGRDSDLILVTGTE